MEGEPVESDNIYNKQKLREREEERRKKRGETREGEKGRISATNRN